VKYNIFRWYRAGWGRYTQADLLDNKGREPQYAYAIDSPVMTVDPLGLAIRMCCRRISVWGRIAEVNHCYFQINATDTVGLYPAETSSGVTGLPSHNDPHDAGGQCGPWTNTDACVRRMGISHPPFAYSDSGPNSNTYARCISYLCTVPRPALANAVNAPGWNSPLRWDRCRGCNGGWPD